VDARLTGALCGEKTRKKEVYEFRVAGLRGEEQKRDGCFVCHGNECAAWRTMDDIEKVGELKKKKKDRGRGGGQRHKNGQSSWLNPGRVSQNNSGETRGKITSHGVEPNRQ